jgi:hypothetical protein
MFYTRKEIAVRLAVFYTGNMFASSFSGLIAAGIFAGLDQVKGLAGWQWYVADPDCSDIRLIASLGSSSFKELYQLLPRCWPLPFCQITP